MFLIVTFEVVQVSQLARLAYSFTASKSLVAVKTQAVIYVVTKAHKKQNCADCSTCASFTRVAVNADHVFWVLFDMSTIEIALTFYPIKRLLRNLINKIEGWSMVIRPGIRGDVALEI